MASDFANDIARLCFDHYKTSLPKKGKPASIGEWTSLAAFVLSDIDDSFRVVSMATGSKCIDAGKMVKDGTLVNDSHAEILARRAFVRFLLGEIGKAVETEESNVVIQKTPGKWHIKNGISFHFFCSQTPCGDAAIFPRFDTCTNCQGEDDSEITSASKRIKMDLPADLSYGATENRSDYEFEQMQTVITQPGNSSYTISGTKRTHPSNANAKHHDCTLCCHRVTDVHRTGAKCVPGAIQDPKLPRASYHVTGSLRTKPGRSSTMDGTLSMSCSDKMARWNVIGCQGALLMHLLEEPVYVSSVIIGKSEFSATALHRAIVQRVSCIGDLPKPYRVNMPMIAQTDLSFHHGREQADLDFLREACRKVWPCGASIVWANVEYDSLEVLVNGRKQGATKSKSSLSVCSSVCKRELFILFLSVLHKCSMKGRCQELPDVETYAEYKQRAFDYQSAWQTLRCILSKWQQKDSSFDSFSVII